MGGVHTNQEEIGMICRLKSSGLKNSKIAKRLTRSPGFISRIVTDHWTPEYVPPAEPVASNAPTSNGHAPSESDQTAKLVAAVIKSNLDRQTKLQFLEILI